MQAATGGLQAGPWRCKLHQLQETIPQQVGQQMHAVLKLCWTALQARWQEQKRLVLGAAGGQECVVGCRLG